MSDGYGTRFNLILPLACLVALITFGACQLVGQTSWSTNDRTQTGGSLRGQVVTLDGQLVPNVQVELRSLTGVTVSRSMVDASGSFVFSDVPVDFYDVVVEVGASEIRNRVYVSIANPELTIKLPSAENTQAPTARLACRN
ncbi:MAG: carboxypeptidase-like regulatory domain-containing protein [Acidobacteriaceae bacterium]